VTLYSISTTPRQLRTCRGFAGLVALLDGLSIALSSDPSFGAFLHLSSRVAPD
jgi:hypothetical protein